MLSWWRPADRLWRNPAKVIIPERAGGICYTAQLDRTRKPLLPFNDHPLIRAICGS